MDSRLFGLWVSEPTESENGTTRLHFFENGDLLYVVRSEQRDEVSRLTYTTQGDVIISDQPSVPRKEATKYFIDEDGFLLLEHGGVRSRYRRISK
jgi:hypothetical protein